MLDKLFSSQAVAEALRIIQNEFPLAVWETFYVTVISTAIAIVIGLPLAFQIAALSGWGTQRDTRPLKFGMRRICGGHAARS